eukprot:Gb_12870 [translate_table: standard]
MEGNNSQQKWRNALGVLKDATTVAIANINSYSKDLEIAIVKATSHVELPPKEKHVAKILTAISGGQRLPNVVYCLEALAKRLAKTRNWAVALKTLVVFHRILISGNCSFMQKFIYSPHTRNIFCLYNFMDESTPLGPRYSAWLLRYSLYLEEKVKRMIPLKSDGNAIDVLPVAHHDALEDLPALQRLLHIAMNCIPERTIVGNYLIQHAFSFVMKESFEIVSAINDGIPDLVDTFFEMPRHVSLKVFHIYTRLIQQSAELSAFYEACRGFVELMFGANNCQFPELLKYPQSYLETMQEYVGETASFVPRLEQDSSVTQDVEGLVESYEAQKQADESRPETSVNPNNALTLDIVPILCAPSAPSSNNYNPSGWELALLNMPSSNESNKTPRGSESMRFADFKKTLDSLYEKEMAKQGNILQCGGQGILQCLNEHQNKAVEPVLNPDLFSNSITDPADMAQLHGGLHMADMPEHEPLETVHGQQLEVIDPTQPTDIPFENLDDAHDIQSRVDHESSTDSVSDFDSDFDFESDWINPFAKP